MIEPPCDQNCPERSETCHGTCEKYRNYDADNKKRREEKDADKEYIAYIVNKRKKWR